MADEVGLLVNNNDVYHVVDKSHADHRSIRTAVETAFSIPQFIGVLTSLPHGLVLAGVIRQGVTDENLIERAHAAKAIIVGAYDCESYVLWER